MKGVRGRGNGSHKDLPWARIVVSRDGIKMKKERERKKKKKKKKKKKRKKKKKKVTEKEKGKMNQLDRQLRIKRMI